MYSILLVDDEKSIREHLPKAIPFEKHGFTVKSTAPNGKQAMDKLSAICPDLILLDMRMPVMDGLEFLKLLRSSDYSNTQVAMLSGYNEFEYAKEAMKYGVRAYISKPVDEEELIPFLDTLCRELDGYRHKKERRDLREMIEQTCTTATAGVCKEAIEYIRLHYSEQINLKKVAKKFFVNASYLGRTFQKAVGVSFTEYVNQLRIDEAKRLLLQTDKLIYEIANQVGFIESSYFVVKFTQEAGKSPTEYRNDNLV